MNNGGHHSPRSLAMKMTVQMVNAIVVRIEIAPFRMMSSSIPENAGLKPPLLCRLFGDFTIFELLSDFQKPLNFPFPTASSCSLCDRITLL
jgi:hypothetical protein